MNRRLKLGATLALAVVLIAGIAAQQRGRGNGVQSFTRAMYTSQTELFAEGTPAFIVGQPTRFTAHLTKVGERFHAYTEGRVKPTLTVGSTSQEVTAEGPERAGVFRLPLTPTVHASASTSRAAKAFSISFRSKGRPSPVSRICRRRPAPVPRSSCPS